jgi:hypothetical protein
VGTGVRSEEYFKHCGFVCVCLDATLGYILVLGNAGSRESRYHEQDELVGRWDVNDWCVDNAEKTATPDTIAVAKERSDSVMGLM